LYSQRVYMTNFFHAYTEADPTDITLSSLTVDTSNNLTVQGLGKSYASVAKLARALTAAGGTSSPTYQPFFTNVQITSVAGTPGRGVAFSIGATLQSGVTSGGQ